VVVSGFTLRNVGQAADGCGPGPVDDVLECAGNSYAAAVFADGHTVFQDSNPQRRLALAQREHRGRQPDRLGADDNIEADPLLVSAGSGYTCAAGSPAIDRSCAADPVPLETDGSCSAWEAVEE
jgi:hypothetical protein